jgi:hypothetical protein
MLKTNFDPNEYVAPSQVDATVVGHVTVSTASWHKKKGNRDFWETCLFDDRKTVGLHEQCSEVVAMYTSKLEAQVGHRRIVDALKFFKGE